MEDLERKMIAEALNKCDKLVQCVELLQDEINVLRETSQETDLILAEGISELHESVASMNALLMGMIRMPGQ